MRYPNLNRLLATKPTHIWCSIRILYEAEKAVLIYNDGKTSVPKSGIWNIRLRDNTFEIYVREGTLL
jgi:hypothetical protein